MKQLLHLGFELVDFGSLGSFSRGRRVVSHGGEGKDEWEIERYLPLFWLRSAVCSMNRPSMEILTGCTSYMPLERAIDSASRNGWQPTPLILPGSLPRHTKREKLPAGYGAAIHRHSSKTGTCLPEGKPMVPAIVDRLRSLNQGLRGQAHAVAFHTC
ncbi:MAG: hypothetical protein EBR20_07245 [Bacteroidetes bacterium]|nr:hypothetical protein [Bacteroidota bacterium]